MAYRGYQKFLWHKQWIIDFIIQQPPQATLSVSHHLPFLLLFLEPDPVAIIFFRGVEGDLLAADGDDLAGGALLQRLLARVPQGGHLIPAILLLLPDLVSEGDHGEDEAGEGGEEDSSEGAQRDALRVVQDGTLVPLAARPVTPRERLE